ncbi:hypothetical protein Tco_0299276 [Tanacetum coccineum]
MLLIQQLDNLSDAVICTFLASQPNSPQFAHEDLEQLHPDDLEEMDLKWQMAMLTIRARMFFKNTKKKLTLNNNETVGFNKSKVECYNRHKRGYFARECRAPRNQDSRNKKSTRRTVPVKTLNLAALVSCDGLGYDWSDQVEEGPTNYALMAYLSSSSDFEVSKESTCSKSYLKIVELLKSQNEQLSTDLKKSNLLALKDIKKLKWEIKVRDITIRELRKKLDIALKEKNAIQLTVDKLENASKSLTTLIDYQIVDNCEKGLGYNIVPPPYTGKFLPLKLDFSFIGVNELVNEHVVENPKANSNEEEPKMVRKNDGASIIKD